MVILQLRYEFPNSRNSSTKSIQRHDPHGWMLASAQHKLNNSLFCQNCFLIPYGSRSSPLIRTLHVLLIKLLLHWLGFQRPELTQRSTTSILPTLLISFRWLLNWFTKLSKEQLITHSIYSRSSCVASIACATAATTGQ